MSTLVHNTGFKTQLTSVNKTFDMLIYSQTPRYGHSLNTVTSLLRTVCFVPEERKPFIRTLPDGPLSVSIDGFDYELPVVSSISLFS